jgi:hypothetical protein
MADEIIQRVFIPECISPKDLNQKCQYQNWTKRQL